MDPHNYMQRRYWEPKEQTDSNLKGILLGVGYAILVLTLISFAIFS
jgi:hypothetical protein